MSRKAAVSTQQSAISFMVEAADQREVREREAKATAAEADVFPAKKARPTSAVTLVLFAALFLSASASAAERVECGSIKSSYVPAAVGYCALLPPSYDSQPTKKFPVLYFL